MRQRSADFRCADIEALIKRVREQDGEGLPPAAVSFVTRPQATPLEPDDDPFGGPPILPSEPLQPGRWSAFAASGAGVGAGKPEPRRFFPLPYNDEQMRTVRRLDDDAVHGVVVQGPPGTGKTHTIANIICHYMATGRRVLVSARTPEALSAIQQKLPAEVRDLAIAIIQSDREGARQLETAVDILSSQVKQIDRAAYRRLLSDLEEKLARVQGELASIDRRIAEHAALNLTEVTYRGQRYVPMALAAVVEDERAAHAWFPDQLDMDERCDARFEAADIADARAIRAALGADIAYPTDQLPRADILPDVPRLLAVHQALARQQVSKARAEGGELPLVSASGATTDDARSLLDWLRLFGEWLADVARDGWITDLYRTLLGARHADPAAKAALHALCQEWIGLTFAGSQFALRGVETPGVEPGNPPFDAAVEALANGRKPFGVLAFGKSSLKAQIDAARVEARAPQDTAAWRLARDYRVWQKRAHAFLGRWSAAAGAVGFPPPPPDWQDGRAELLRLGRLVERMHDLHLQAEDRMGVVAALFPFGVDARRVVLHGEIGAVCEALACHLEQGSTDARGIRQRLAAMQADAALPFHAALAEIRAALGNPAVDPRQLAEGWQRILAEARRLDGLRALRERLEAIAGSVAASGAPQWAARLLLDGADASDALTPASWPQAWEWARAAGYVRRISRRGTVVELSARHAALEREQRAVMGEMVRVTTFLGLKRGITAGMASALARFSLAVRELGAGTGKSANRRRRAIREAALDAAAAVPCWILPEWRVAEQLPSQLGTFDLVIIDEASQSDITALPVVMRGKKLLVVGDDKQVSPSAVAIEEAFIVRLRETFLRGTVLEAALEPATSLYDIAAITMPGAVILLREHFRCVEPLIRYSSKLYPKALIPLRIPTAAERLEPPLVDIYVPDGRRALDVNRAEADAVVAEITRLIGDPAYAGRSMGVISLIGDKQAKHIQDRLVAEIGTEAMTRHRLTCGNAATFQGQERDIMFLSMVACPHTQRAQTAKSIQQRFNVAMSRARDRLYLVRSVTASMLAPNDLKLGIIEHFRAPMEGAVAPQGAHVLDACDSPFEREVGGRLLQLGYRLRPQVEVGGFRIDFVVEGAANRLAVELDGDKYHGPDRWAADLHRQRALERMGWVFWRCWGSHWLADPEACLDDLLSTLQQLGIEPLGGGALSPAVWTEHRTIRTPAESAEPLVPPRVLEPQT